MEVESLIYDSIQPSITVGKGKHGQVKKCKYQSYVCCYKTMDTEKVDPQKLTKLVQQLHSDMNRLMGNNHIIQFIGTCVDTSKRLLVMTEYVSGSSLKSYILRPPKVHPTPNWEVRAKMAYQIAQGLEFLHNHNYVHRNLYSRNILIDFDDYFNAKIGDFGLHDIRDEIDTVNQTNRDLIDFYWKAPELKDTKYSSCSKKGDIYALGTVFWELVTNQDAITLETPSAQQAIEGAPQTLIECMLNCLVENPIERPSCQDLTSTLFEFADQDDSDFNSEDASQPPTMDRVATRDMVQSEYPDSAQMVSVNQGKQFLDNKEYVKAAKCFDAPAWEGNSEAQYYLSQLYMSGNGRTRNLRTAINWLDKSARQGFDKAEYLLALTFYHGIGQRKDRDEAVVILRRIAKKYPPAKLMLAYCYEVGQGIDRDSNRALQLYKELTAENIPMASHKVADILVSGKDIELDPVNAIEYYRKAANQKDLYSLYRLGRCYELGIGTEVSKAQAFKYYDQASKLGYLAAIHAKAVCFENGSGVNKDLPEAAVLYLEAARRGHLASQHQIARFFQHGLGVPQNHERAVYWYHSASKSGNRSSQNNLGRCYQLGFGTAQNSELAVYWYQKSSDQGCTPAKINLAVCYEKGDGVAKDYSKAFDLYQSASEKGNPHAHYKLGFCFENGLGVEQDLIKALKLYKASGAGGYERGKQRYQDLKKQVNPQLLLQRNRSFSERNIATITPSNMNDNSFSEITPSINDIDMTPTRNSENSNNF